MADGQISAQNRYNQGNDLLSGAESLREHSFSTEIKRYRHARGGSMAAKLAGMFLSVASPQALIGSGASGATPAPTDNTSSTDDLHNRTKAVAPSHLGSVAAISEVGALTLVGDDEMGNLRVRVVRVERINQVEGENGSRLVTVAPEPLFVPIENPVPIKDQPTTVFNLQYAEDENGGPDYTKVDVTFKFFLSSQMLRQWGKEVAGVESSKNINLSLQDQYPVVGALIVVKPDAERNKILAAAMIHALQSVDLDSIIVKMRFRAEDYEKFKRLAAKGPREVGFESFITYDGYRMQSVEIDTQAVQELKTFAQSQIKSRGKQRGDNSYLLTQGDVNEVVNQVSARIKSNIRGIGGPEAAQIALAEAANPAQTLVLSFLKEQTLTGRQARELTSQPEVKAQLASRAQALKLKTAEGREDSSAQRSLNADESGNKDTRMHAESVGGGGGFNFFGLLGGGGSTEVTDANAHENFNRKLSEFEQLTGVKMRYDKAQEMYVPDDITVYQANDTESKAELSSQQTITLALHLEDRAKRGPFVPIGFNQRTVMENIERHFALKEKLADLRRLQMELSELYGEVSEERETKKPYLLGDIEPERDMFDSNKLTERLGKAITSSWDYHQFEYLNSLMAEGEEDRTRLNGILQAMAEPLIARIRDAASTWTKSVKIGTKGYKSSDGKWEALLTAETAAIARSWSSTFPQETQHNLYSFESALQQLQWGAFELSGVTPPNLKDMPKVVGHPAAWAASANNIMSLYVDRHPSLSKAEMDEIRIFFEEGKNWARAVGYYYAAARIFEDKVGAMEQQSSEISERGNSDGRIVISGPKYLYGMVAEPNYLANRENWHKIERQLMHTKEFWQFVEAELLLSCLIASLTGDGSTLVPNTYGELLFRLSEIRDMQDLDGANFSGPSAELCKGARPIAKKVVDTMYHDYLIRYHEEAKELYIKAIAAKADPIPLHGEKPFEPAVEFLIVRLGKLNLIENMAMGLFERNSEVDNFQFLKLWGAYLPFLDVKQSPFMQHGVLENFLESFSTFERFAKEIGIEQ